MMVRRNRVQIRRQMLTLTSTYELIWSRSMMDGTTMEMIHALGANKVAIGCKVFTMSICCSSSRVSFWNALSLSSSSQQRKTASWWYNWLCTNTSNSRTSRYWSTISATWQGQKRISIVSLLAIDPVFVVCLQQGNRSLDPRHSMHWSIRGWRMFCNCKCCVNNLREAFLGFYTGDGMLLRRHCWLHRRWERQMDSWTTKLLHRLWIELGWKWKHEFIWVCRLAMVYGIIRHIQSSTRFPHGPSHCTGIHWKAKLELWLDCNNHEIV